MGEVMAPGGGPAGALAGETREPGGGAGTGAGAPAADEATGTVMVAVMVRATRMRRSPFSTSISVRSVSARRVASSRTRSGSKGLALAIVGTFADWDQVLGLARSRRTGTIASRPRL